MCEFQMNEYLGMSSCSKYGMDLRMLNENNLIDLVLLKKDLVRKHKNVMTK